MRSRLTALLLGLIMAFTVRPASAAPSMDQYVSTPFWLEGRTIPLVMLVLERDWKMFYPAYNNLSDLDGDGALDIGFNPKVTYVGYFDSNSCYRYNRTGGATTPEETGLFVRVGPTTPQTQADADRLAQDRGIAANTNLTYPASTTHGVCGGSGSRAQGLGEWHGNWLNYALTSRMDAIRKVLYGGKRSSDTASETILEMVRVPANANVWGGEIYADDLWEEYAPSSPWYAVELFTGFNPPTSRAMHFWARGDYYWTSPMYTTSTPTPSTTSTQQQTRVQNKKPLFRVVSNVPSTNRHPFLKVPLRHWDWTGDHSSYNSIPSDGHLANSKNPSGATNNGFMAGGGGSKYLAWHFAAQVKVCESGNMSETEGCQAYGSSYKPVGLLQNYGEADRMFFGLVTGTISHGSPGQGYGENDGYRYKGGVVRHHIQDFSKYVNRSTGVIVRPGLIDTIDGFEITGIGSAKSYTDGSQAGNPLGEMVWEALRYLGGKDKPTSDYGAASSEKSVTRSGKNSDTSFTLPKETTWTNRPTLEGNAGDCPKAVILAISEVFPDHDGDDFPNLNDFSSVPSSSFADSNADLAGTFVINNYLKIITEVDSLRSGLSGTQFFYADNDRLCTAKALSTGLEQVKGHCPSEPSLKGSYSLSAVAYYAHTHDFESLAAKGKAGNVDFYAVGIPGNFPDITLTISDTESVTLMPIAMSAPISKQYDGTEGPTDPNFKTLLNFFIEYWQADDGHQYVEDGVKKTRRIPYRVRFRTNFEYTTFPCFVNGGNSNNWERDLFTSTTITLLADASTPAKYRDGEPLFINSGPFKTRDKATYLNHRKNYRAAGSPDDASGYFNSSQNNYYYAFRRPLGEALDLNSSELKGHIAGIAVHTDSVGSGYGASGLSGYTISGVTFPGAYLDVGLYRLDYPIYYSKNSACTPDQTVFVPNPNGTCDEAVPLDPAGTGLPGVIYNFASGTAHPHPGSSNGFTSHTSATNGSDCGYYHPPTMYDDRLTPAECPYAGYTDTSPWTDPDLVANYGSRPKAEDVCGKWAAGSTTGNLTSKQNDNNKSKEPNLFKTSKIRYVQVRSFKFETSSNKKPQSLPNPMWLAAKYGGFKDANANGIPDLLSEWRRGGSGVGANDPYNYFGVANMSQLPDQLGNAFEAIANSVATGTATASSINTVLGGGLSIQTEYNTEHKDLGGNTVKWGGAVYAFFVDKWGNLRADTSNKGQGDKRLNMKTSPPVPNGDTDPFDKAEYLSLWSKATAEHGVIMGEGLGSEVGDLIVHTVTPNGGSGTALVYLCRDMYGDNNGNWPLPDNVAYPSSASHPDRAKYPPHADCKPVDSGKFYDAHPVWNAAAQLTKQGHANRDVFSYFDKPSDPMKTADGSVAWPSGGVSISDFEFKNSSPFLDGLHKLMGQINTATTGNLIDYIRGKDFPQYRNRTAKLPWDPSNAAAKTWIMGDVINSKPVIVGDAVSNFHLLYNSGSYTDFKEGKGHGQAARRRQMAYFGANDGMLYAVNLGYFGALQEGLAGYDLKPAADASISAGPYSNRPLGDVLWSYVPPAVLPHLQWLADPAYQHGFYVDLKPYVIDITDSGGKWRSILLVGLRLGGRSIEVVNAGTPNNPIYSYSEYFAMDVTDPDSGPPKLLWRFSHPYLGLPTATPAVVRSGNDWYAVLPSGPTSDEQPDGANGLIYPRPQEETGGAKAYEGRSTQTARVFIVNARTGKLVRDPLTDPVPLIAEEENSFFNDTFLPRAVHVADDGSSWSHYVVYMGMTAVDAAGRDTGAVYRLQMVEADTGVPLPVADWKLTRMYKTDKPVTGAVNAAYDPVGNLWVVFGTGRVWSSKDLTPCGGLYEKSPDTSPGGCCDNHTQYFYGLKELMKDKKHLTFKEITDHDKILDVSGLEVFDNGEVYSDQDSSTPVYIYSNLYQMLISDDTLTFKRGYKRKLESWRGLYIETPPGSANMVPEPAPALTQFEMVTTQPKIDGLPNGGSNTVFTSYLTSADVCTPDGKSYLNVVDTFTGLPAPYMKTYGGFEPGRSITAGQSAARQITGVKRAGDGMASEAWILKSGSQTVYGNTSFNSNRNKIYLGESEGNAIISWREVLDMNFKLFEKADELGNLYNDLK